MSLYKTSSIDIGLQICTEGGGVKIFYSGLPPSGKTREIFDLLESQGISIFFVESQGKSGKMIWLR